MRRIPGKTHVLYPEKQWHKHANADCYHCGKRERAHRMHWLGHQQRDALFALCQACSLEHSTAYAAFGQAMETPLLEG